MNQFDYRKRVLWRCAVSTHKGCPIVPATSDARIGLDPALRRGMVKTRTSVKNETARHPISRIAYASQGQSADGRDYLLGLTRAPWAQCFALLTKKLCGKSFCSSKPGPWPIHNICTNLQKRRFHQDFHGPSSPR